MATTMLGYLLRQLASESGDSERSDAELLRAITNSQDQGALRTILHRYGRLVWAVCLRLLRNEQNAEDAFQATFIVMVQKAASINVHKENQKEIQNKNQKKITGELAVWRGGSHRAGGSPQGDRPHA